MKALGPSGWFNVVSVRVFKEKDGSVTLSIFSGSVRNATCVVNGDEGEMLDISERILQRCDGLQADVIRARAKSWEEGV